MIGEQSHSYRRHAALVIAAALAALLLLVFATSARGQSRDQQDQPSVERATEEALQGALDGQEQPGTNMPAQGLESGLKLRMTDEEASDLREREAKLGREARPQPHERRIDEDPDGNRYVAGELIVTYEEQTSAAAAQAVNEQANAEVKEDFPEIDAASLSFPEIKDDGDRSVREQGLEDKKQELEQDPNVESVSYNYVDELQAVPNDPLFSSQWGLSRINAPQAWDTATGLGQNSQLAIIDSGVQNIHPDINGAIVSEFDYINGDADANDLDGHGTHVAGIAAANTNNGIGVAGTAPLAPIFDYKVCELALGCPNDAQIAAITDATTLGADVINMSLGGYGVVPAREAAVNNAWNNGVVVVAAAGNDAVSTELYPAANPNAIAVSGTDINDGDSDFSNFGAWVDVAAPGGERANGCTGADDILSTLPNTYGSLCGTSMASPFVAGVAALLDSQGRTAVQIRQRIEGTARDLGPAGKDQLFGFGLVNAQAAVAVTPPPPPPNPCANNVRPTIHNLRPKRGATIVDRTPRIQATVVDREFILSKNRIFMAIDGKLTRRFSYQPSSGKLVYTSRPLRPGSHVVGIRAFDPCGVQRTMIWRFKVR